VVNDKLNGESTWLYISMMFSPLQYSTVLGISLQFNRIGQYR